MACTASTVMPQYFVSGQGERRVGHAAYTPQAAKPEDVGILAAGLFIDISKTRLGCARWHVSGRATASSFMGLDARHKRLDKGINAPSYAHPAPPR